MANWSNSPSLGGSYFYIKYFMTNKQDFFLKIIQHEELIKHFFHGNLAGLAVIIEGKTFAQAMQIILEKHL